MSALAASQHAALALALFCIGTVTSVLAQHLYSLVPYVYMTCLAQVALYVHHQYVSSVLVSGAFVHAGLFCLRDYRHSSGSSSSALDLVLSSKGSLLSHLSWVAIFLGFHTLALFSHNDTVVAFGEADKQLLLEPFFCILITRAAQLPSSGLGTGDLFAHHALAFAVHTSVLVLCKGVFDARGTKLMPDKIYFPLGFACDGPTRGGTCDISSWDSFYLAAFWVLNADAWLMFYFHWRQLCQFENTQFQFDDSATHLNGWLRDYLWFNSAALINGYTSFHASDLAILAWVFLAAHLAWATGFMFLISWRGYWQELIDIIIVHHLKTPILFNPFSHSTSAPVALSIVQARFIGLPHFTSGFILTYAAFVLASTT